MQGVEGGDAEMIQVWIKVHKKSFCPLAFFYFFFLESPFRAWKNPNMKSSE